MGKRCASGYNLYIKECSKDKKFGDCLSERGWSKLSDKDKNKWKEKASKECKI